MLAALKPKLEAKYVMVLTMTNQFNACNRYLLLYICSCLYIHLHRAKGQASKRKDHDDEDEESVSEYDDDEGQPGETLDAAAKRREK